MAPRDTYDSFPRFDSFTDAMDQDRQTALPDNWWVGVADIVGSTGLIAEGRYKTVNMVGAAVISAVRNALSGQAFPFVFGGDGAGFAVPPEARAQAVAALAAVRRWAAEEFGIDMRAACVPLQAIHAAGRRVTVARYRVGPGADYAMFGGGGLLWADRQMKAGHFAVPPAAPGTAPDLTGLSCRWSHVAARNGAIVSVVVEPMPDTPPQAFAMALRSLVALLHKLDRGGHPIPAAGPGADWPPAGAALEAHAARRGKSLLAARLRVLAASLLAAFLIRTGIRVAGFDARRYARVVGENADFRKCDDGLKMTLDCDDTTRAALENLLATEARAGVLRYGIAVQSQAMMTCIVPSPLTDDHIHFVDGAEGGYTLAASRMKSG
ncbi:MAG: DUF3095 domain-containing protein [Rhodobacteraceae bacterium]|nr:DUF3095 domain-containing protein [Paracoccaceae bacterium]